MAAGRVAAMWWAVLVFGIAVNFEPTRIGLITLLLTRQRPIPQLLTFFGTAFFISSTVGLAVLLVFHRGLFGSTGSYGPTIQVGIGIAALLVAVFVATNPQWMRRFHAAPASGESGDARPAEDLQPRRVDQLATRARAVLHGESRWFSGAAGAGTSLPTAEYMALLALIIVSEPSPWTRVVALFTFLILGNTVGLIAIGSYLIAPERTRETVRGFYGWIRARRRRDVVALLVGIGALLIVTGGAQLVNR